MPEKGHKLHPGARWLFRLRAFLVIIILTIAIATLFLNNFLSSKLPLFILIYLFFAIIISEIYAGIAYNFWSYDLTDNNIIIEKGLSGSNHLTFPMKEYRMLKSEGD